MGNVRQIRANALPAAQQRVQQNRKRSQQAEQTVQVSQQNLKTDQLQLNRIQAWAKEGLRSQRDYELVARFIDGEATDAEIKVVERRMADEPEVSAVVFREEQLSALVGELLASSPPDELLPAAAPSASGWGTWFRYLAPAVVLAGVVFAIVLSKAGLPEYTMGDLSGTATYRGTAPVAVAHEPGSTLRVELVPVDATWRRPSVEGTIDGRDLEGRVEFSSSGVIWWQATLPSRDSADALAPGDHVLELRIGGDQVVRRPFTVR
jgi:hypothetical protein